MRTFGRKTYANELSWLAFLRCPLPVKARRCGEIHSQRIILSTASGVLDFERTLSLYTALYRVIEMSACTFYTVKDWKRKRWRQVRGLQGAQLYAHFLKDTRAQDHPLWWHLLKEEQRLHTDLSSVQTERHGLHLTKRIVRRANFPRRAWARTLDPSDQLLVWSPGSWSWLRGCSKDTKWFFFGTPNTVRAFLSSA